jgi:F-type H+-transporting ATPase subunit delta
MAENVTIARPYAEAVFQLAKDKQALSHWSEMLQFAAAVASRPEVRELIGNPRVTTKQIGDFFIGVCGERLDGEARNFILVLIENRRLTVLPEIHELYEELKEDQEGLVEAIITSAFPLSDEQVGQLSARLEAKYRRKVQARVVVDKALIGGVRIQVGDEVTDASVRGRLEQLAQTLVR